MKPNNCIIVKRTGSENEKTDEIEALAQSYGYNIKGIITQSREEDYKYNIGSGKLEEVKNRVKSTNSSFVIFDNILTSIQRYNLGMYLKDCINVLDRYNLILNIFGKNSNSKKSMLQVKLSRLRRELSRIETKIQLSKNEEYPGFMNLKNYNKKTEKNIKDKIKNISDTLTKIKKKDKKRRNQRKELGFYNTSLVGYTNSGKTSLIKTLGKNISNKEHPDLYDPLEVNDSLFTTLEKTSWEMDYDKRKIILTDTIGLMDDLPRWLINSFEVTFNSVYSSDLSLIVVDISDDLEKIRKKLSYIHKVLFNKHKGKLITVFTKIDKIPQEEVEYKKDKLNQTLVNNSICVSSKENININDLKEKVNKTLPNMERKTFKLPMNPSSMSKFSNIHNNTNIKSKKYTENSIILETEAPQKVFEKFIYPN